jgi:hypothetical protein
MDLTKEPYVALWAERLNAAVRRALESVAAIPTLSPGSVPG